MQHLNLEFCRQILKNEFHDICHTAQNKQKSFLIMVSQVEQVPKVKQKKKNNKLTEMLLELKIIAIMNLLTFF